MRNAFAHLVPETLNRTAIYEYVVFSQYDMGGIGTY